MKKKKRKGKTAAKCVAHFQLRCLERIGVIVRQRELKELHEQRHLQVICKQSHTRTLFRVPKSRYSDPLKEDLVVAYDKKRHAFVTVMPYGSWKLNHDEHGNRIPDPQFRAEL